MVEKTLDSLRWYKRTRPDALLHILLPALVTLLTLLFALVWAQPQLIVLAVVFVVAFMLLAGELAGELRDLETDVQTEAAAKREIAPVLTQLAGERAPEADVETEPAHVSERQSLQTLLALPADEFQPNTLSLLSGPAHTPESPAPPAMEHVASPQSEDGPIHEVREPWAGPVLHSCRSFLDACDFAFDYLEESDPDELEIILVNGESRMKVWSYSRSDATALQEIVDGQSATEGQSATSRQSVRQRQA